MRYRIWFLVLLVAMGMTCAKPKEKASETSPTASATAPQEFALKVTFEGLVGYVNTNDNVWALLPRALHDTMPPGYDPDPDILNEDYPEHHAFLKVDGANVKDSGKTGTLYIPITDKEIWITDAFPAGKGIPSKPFRQADMDPADELDSAVLTSKHSKLAARVKLPLLSSEADWLLDEREPDGQKKKFINVNPKKKDDYCEEADFKNPTDYRVQAVTWEKQNLAGEVTLKLWTLDKKPLPSVVLVPNGQPTIQVGIVNQVSEALHDPMHEGIHLPAYRWFYNLSILNKPEDCPKHYYPQGDLGGNRCPQKLFHE